MTARSDTGVGQRDAVCVASDKIACPIRNATNAEITDTTAATTVNTPELRPQHRQPPRARRTWWRGSCPVEYSPVIIRTPSTPMASWARNTPRRLCSLGSIVAAAPPGSQRVHRATTNEQTRMPRPTVMATDATSV